MLSIEIIEDMLNNLLIHLGRINEHLDIEPESREECIAEYRRSLMGNSSELADINSEAMRAMKVIQNHLSILAFHPDPDLGYLQGTLEMILGHSYEDAEAMYEPEEGEEWDETFYEWEGVYEEDLEDD